MRKRLRKMYIVHEKNWIRILIEMFSTVVSPKFRKKVVHGETQDDASTARLVDSLSGNVRS